MPRAKPKTRHVDPLTEWRAACPLRKWLDKRPVGTAVDLAQKARLSRSTLDYWMRGDVMPRPLKFVFVTKETGITLKQWFEWFCKKPGSPNGVA